MKIKKIFYIFLTSFLLDLAWQNWHSRFFDHYQGGDITQFVLIRATLFDTVFMVLLIFILSKLKYLNRTWFFITFSVLFSILMEIYALKTGRWGYDSSMIIIPFIKTGLTPTIQLALLGYASAKINKISFSPSSSGLRP